MSNLYIIDSHAVASTDIKHAHHAPQLYLSDLGDSRNLSERLQTTLELDEMLEIYAGYVVSQLPISAIRFEHKQYINCFTFNEAGQHSNHFSVGLLGRKLGQLTYQSQAPLCRETLKQLQQMHRKLAYPLRNALQYHELKQSALQDKLTGLGNRAAFDEALPRYIEQARRAGIELGLMVLDLDNFKQLNDSKGHLAGDEALSNFAGLLKYCIRASDSAFRLGGDEFVVIFYDASRSMAKAVAERLLNSIAMHPQLSSASVGCSMGYADWQGGDSPEKLFERADAALYKAKRLGKHQLVKA